MKLVYFAVNTGRARAIRLTAYWGKLRLTDVKLDTREPNRVVEHLARTPYAALPVLELDDGTQVAQSNAILRYLGKLGALYPEDPIQALYCDEVLDACEEFDGLIQSSLHLSRANQQATRSALCQRELPLLLKGLERALQRDNTPYVTRALSISDFRLYGLIDTVLHQQLAFVPESLVFEQAPRLIEHHQHIEQLAPVQAYNQHWHSAFDKTG